ncbi:MAG: exosortase/archaeosortase family protein [Phycisphaeraceae bacterium]|nr:exosortase/archaeosortase family protein [Phycisphaeraceae bacterium]
MKQARLPARWGWLSVGVLGLLFMLLYSAYFYQLLRVITDTRRSEVWLAVKRLLTFEVNSDWAHVLVIPLFSLYFLRLRSEEIRRTARRVYLPGLVVMMAGIAGYILWIYPGRNNMFQGLSMVLTLFGLVLFLVGPRMMTLVWFPIAYLVFSVKISDRVWDAVAWKLQLIAAKSSALALSVLGLALDIEASVRGSTIDLWVDGKLLRPPLNVAEACSGLRMLMAFVALGVAIAFITPRPWWQRLIMLALTLPIAVLVNVGRVTVLGVLYAKVDPELAQGDVHLLIGMLMLIPAALLCLLVGWVLDHVVIREEQGGRDRADAVTVGVDEAVACHPGDLADARGLGRGVVTGAGLGVGAGGLMCLLYTLAWSYWRPEAIFGAWLSVRGAGWLIAMSVVGLAGVFWGIGRSLRPERAPGGGLPVRAMAVSGAVILTCFLGLNQITAATRLVLVKQPLELRTALRNLPQQVGSWKMVREEGPLPADIVKALGTEEYLMRQYFDESTPNQAGSLLVLHVTYYTGTPDTVPHVPDRCFVAGGVRPVETTSRTLRLSGPQFRPTEGGYLVDTQLALRVAATGGAFLPGLEIPATVFTFDDPNRPEVRSNAIYFFVANGRYFGSPNDVRRAGFDPMDKYSYHAKVEVQVYQMGDAARAAARVESFLSQMLPEIMTALPDWRAVTSGQYDRLKGATTTTP